MKKAFGVFLFFLTATMLVPACSSKSGGGGAPPSQATQLSGVVASGGPWGNQLVSIKGENGMTASAMTGADGSYSANVSGLTTPFLLRCVRSTATGTRTLYSVATEAGTVNVHPFTDLIIRNWYRANGTTVDTAFGASGAIPTPPTNAEVATIEGVVRQVVGNYLSGAGIDSSQFDLITTPFSANSTGFDLVLDNLQVAYSGGNVAVTPRGGGTDLMNLPENTDLATLPPPPPPPADSQAPTTPTGLAASRTSASQVVLSWGASTDNVGVVGYRIFRNGIQVGIIDQSFFVDGSAPATGACYSVAAFDASRNVSASTDQTCASDTVGTADTTPPTAPVLSGSAASASEVDLSWTASTDNVALAGYRIIVNGLGIASVPTTTTQYLVTGLTGSTTYHFRVVAIDTSGNPAASNIVDVTTAVSTDTTPPTAPANLTATATSASQIDLAWTAATDNVGVTAYRIVSGGILIGRSQTTAFSNTGLATGTQYCYAVRAVDAAGNVSALSNQACATTTTSTAPIDTIWQSSLAGTVFNNESGSGQTTYLTLRLTQTGGSIAGTLRFEDTLGRTGSAIVSGSVSGSTLTAQSTDFDPACNARTITETGTLGSSALTLAVSAPAAGSCSALSDSLVFSLITPVIYTASGTYTYDSSSATLTIDVTSSTFPGTSGGPKIGTDGIGPISVSATSMVWPGDNPTWTRSSGTAGDVTGVWRTIAPDGNAYTLTINADGSFQLSAAFVSNGTGAGLVQAQTWPGSGGGNEYFTRPLYNDPNHAITDITVMGPGLTSALTMTYNPSDGSWNTWNLPGNPISFGTSHPQPPLGYIFTITDAAGTRTESATAGCFIEQFATNLSAVKNTDGSVTFSWTPLATPHMGYAVEIQNPSGGQNLWQPDDQTDVSSMTYTGTALSTGQTYNYDVRVDSRGSLHCSSFASGSFTY